MVRAPRSVIPASFRTSLPYGHSAIIAATTVGFAGGIGFLYQFRSNSVNDPDFTGGGHQPRGYDQWSVFYNKAYVHKVHVTVRMSNSEAVNDTLGILEMFHTESPTAGVLGADNLYSNVEQRLDPKLGDVMKHTNAAGSGGRTQWVFLNKTYYPGTWLKEYDYNDRSALTNQNPVAESYISVLGRFPSTTTTRSFRLEVTLKYDVTFYDPKSFVGS